MKNTLLIFAFTMTGLFATAQTKVIEYPTMGKRTTDFLEFYQVEVSDTAVILKGELYNRPNNWVSVASSSVLKGKQTGKIYRLVRANGIKLDNNEFMPDSWNRSFTLQFKPVDKRDKSVDFDEMLPQGNGFQISGITLEKKEIKKKTHCLIQGKVVDNPAYSRLMLIPEGNDPRVQEWISIPVKNGVFSYDLYTDQEEPYELYAWSDNLSGMWQSATFFSENGKMEITLYSLDKEPEIRSEAVLTKELLRFQQDIENQFSKPMWSEKERLEREGKMEAFQTEYIKSNPTLVGLFLLSQQVAIMRDNKDAAAYITIYNNVYANKFQGSPITNYMKTWILSNSIKVGGKFIDFTAPDLEGVKHQLSEEIKGKVALIDLWASWCGPCRQTSISMIPVYEAYKEKGFTVVGVARERNANDMKNAIVKDKYPWTNLLELNDAGKIWEQYGVGNAGGRTLLVDKEGTIVAIHPTAEEVKAWLDKLL